MKSRSRGFTLTELLVALAVAGLILGLAAPSFNDFRRNNRLTGAANDFLAATQVARTEAIKRQLPVSMCATADPTAAGAACNGGAYSSWIVFVDTNSNCLRAGAAEVIVKTGGPVDASVTSQSNGNCISFAPTGFMQPAAVTGRAASTRTVFCDDRGLAVIAGQAQSAGRGIFVTNTGRSRVTRDVTSGSNTDLSTWGLGCP